MNLEPFVVCGRVWSIGAHFAVPSRNAATKITSINPYNPQGLTQNYWMSVSCSQNCYEGKKDAIRSVVVLTTYLEYLFVPVVGSVNSVAEGDIYDVPGCRQELCAWGSLFVCVYSSRAPRTNSLVVVLQKYAIV